MLKKKAEYLGRSCSEQSIVKKGRTEGGDLLVVVVAPETKKLEEVFLLVVENGMVKFGLADAPHEKYFRAVSFASHRHGRGL